MTRARQVPSATSLEGFKPPSKEVAEAQRRALRAELSDTPEMNRALHQLHVVKGEITAEGEPVAYASNLRPGQVLRKDTLDGIGPTAPEAEPAVETRAKDEAPPVERQEPPSPAPAPVLLEDKPKPAPSPRRRVLLFGLIVAMLAAGVVALAIATAKDTPPTASSTTAGPAPTTTSSAPLVATATATSLPAPTSAESVSSGPATAATEQSSSITTGPATSTPPRSTTAPAKSSSAPSTPPTAKSSAPTPSSTLPWIKKAPRQQP